MGPQLPVVRRSTDVRRALVTARSPTTSAETRRADFCSLFSLLALQCWPNKANQSGFSLCLDERQKQTVGGFFFTNGLPTAHCSSAVGLLNNAAVGENTPPNSQSKRGRPNSHSSSQCVCLVTQHEGGHLTPKDDRVPIPVGDSAGARDQVTHRSYQTAA